ncbi:MAG: NUDIX hydrolase [Deltaproteobacteria bacterium]|nr:MAG: NUDIX hydrolase [Deltaproteobacteria bacterium]
MNPKGASGGLYPEMPRPAVGAVVFKDDAVLLVKRGKAPACGMWAIPGGSVHLGETLQAAAEREILEETGVVIRAGDPVLVFDNIQHDAQGDIQFHYVIVDMAAEYIRGRPRAAADAADARWVREDELKHLTVSHPTLQLLKEKYHFGEKQT